MDANGLKFWMLPQPYPWVTGETVEVSDQQRLRLSSRQLPPWTESDEEMNEEIDEVTARSRLNQVPQARDAFGNRAFWDDTTQQVMAVGVTPVPVPIYRPDDGAVPTDLAMGYDGILYIAIAGQVVLVDVRDRWDPVTVPLSDFNAWRLAAHPDGGVWVLDQNLADRFSRQLARLTGTPWPRRPPRLYSPGVFRPCEENPNPPQLRLVWSGTLDADEEPVAIACNDQGQLIGLSWVADSDARLRYLHTNDTWTDPLILTRLPFPYSLTWLNSQRVALLNHHIPNEATVYHLPTVSMVPPLAEESPSPLNPVGEFYPLRNHDQGSFLQGITRPPHYSSQDPTASEPSPQTGSIPLVPLSLPTLAKQGEASSAQPFDSGDPQTVWHRLYLEAILPVGCGVQIDLATSNQEQVPDASEWFEHRLGTPFAPDETAIPVAAWVPFPSEIPHHPGLLKSPLEKDRSGLFTILIQRHNRRVRALKGRYLWVRVRLTGTGRATPELAALRAYASRFSYVDQYLPELYHETEFGPEADDVGNSTPADFLERFLNNIEGILTPLEDRIAQAYRLTQPQTAPEEALEWLGSWLGVALDSAYPPERYRKLLENTPELYRRRGTLKGLELALDVATGGAVTGGEVIVVEDFRLRRTFATILGRDLAEETNPLLQGLAVSGNSIVGDSLILGDEENEELLALFNADVLPNDEEPEAVETFFRRLAYRVTVLVHQTVTPQDLGLIRHIVEMEAPAHLSIRVVTARFPLMVGVASLVGVDTYLPPPQVPGSINLDQSRIGIRDLVQRPASLDPRMEGSVM